MALKGHAKEKIDWSVVHDALDLIWRGVKHRRFNNLSKGDIYKIVPRRNKRWSKSIAYALDDSLVYTHKSNGRTVIDGLTGKGEMLYTVLSNEWFFKDVRDWASARGVTLTSDKIVDISGHISRENLKMIVCKFR